MLLIISGIILLLLIGAVILGAREDKDSGFSMIELLVVIGIIALLTTLAYVYLGGTTAKARDAKRLNDLNQLGRFLSFGCPVPGAGAGTYDLSGLIAELKSQYPQYADKIPDDIRDPKSGTAAVSNYTYILNSDNDCVLYANLENAEAEITLPALSAPTPRGGKGILEGAVPGANSTDRYFQISN